MPREKSPRVAALGRKKQQKTRNIGKKTPKKTSPQRGWAGSKTAIFPGKKKRWKRLEKGNKSEGKKSKVWGNPEPGIAPGIGASIPKGKIRVWKPQKRPRGLGWDNFIDY